MTVLLYFLFFSDHYGRNLDTGRELRYNLKPFAEILRFWTYREMLGTRSVGVNIFGNVAAFVPFGFILPIVVSWMRSGGAIILSGFLTSLTVELLQLVTRVGSFDVDDLILNTLGTALGFICFTICNRIRRNIYG